MGCQQDKYHRQTLDGEPHHRGLNLERRIIPKAITKKFGRPRDAHNVKAMPASLNLFEHYWESPGNSNVMTEFMRVCSRPVDIRPVQEVGKDSKSSTVGDFHNGQGPMSAREPNSVTSKHMSTPHESTGFGGTGFSGFKSKAQPVQPNTPSMRAPMS